jgi:CHASE2 domain-containing sensor protein
MKEMAIQDIDFSDIHYQTRDIGKLNNKNIVLINTGGISPDSLRYKLVELIKSLNYYSPKAIGIDYYFQPKNDSTFHAINIELDSLFQNNKMVVGCEYGGMPEFPLNSNSNLTKKINFGSINFVATEKETQREYYYRNRSQEHGHIDTTKDTTLSFACKIYQVADGAITQNHRETSFFINYSCATDKGFYNAFPA